MSLNWDIKKGFQNTKPNTIYLLNGNSEITRTWTYCTSCSSVSIVAFDFVKVNSHWQIISLESLTKFQNGSHLRMCKGSISV